jgi:hypothetical protein
MNIHDCWFLLRQWIFHSKCEMWDMMRNPLQNINNQRYYVHMTIVDW